MEEILKGISDFVKECLGPLGGAENYGWPDWIRDFCVQILATLFLFLIVRFFLWKPVTNFLEARKKSVDNELEQAKKAHSRALSLENELKQKIAQSKEEINALIAQAVLEGNKQKEEIITEAKMEAARRIKQAEEAIQYEIQEQQNDLKKQIVDVAFIAAEAILGKEVNKEKYLFAVEKLIDGGMKHEK